VLQVLALKALLNCQRVACCGRGVGCSAFDLVGQKIPKRQIVANTCQWIYRSAECGYSGSNYFDVNGNSVSTLADDVCGKRIASCKLRFGENGELPFGSFPGAGLIVEI